MPRGAVFPLLLCIAACDAVVHLSTEGLTQPALPTPAADLSQAPPSLIQHSLSRSAVDGTGETAGITTLKTSFPSVSAPTVKPYLLDRQVQASELEHTDGNLASQSTAIGAAPAPTVVACRISPDLRPCSNTGRGRQGSAAGAGQRHSGYDPVRRLLRQLQRRRQLPSLGQPSNYSVVLVTQTGPGSEPESGPKSGANATRESRSNWNSESRFGLGSELESKSELVDPLSWPRLRPPVPVTATLVGVPRPAPNAMPLSSALDRVTRWLRDGRRGTTQAVSSRGAGRLTGTAPAVHQHAKAGPVQASNVTRTDERIGLTRPTYRLKRQNVTSVTILKTLLGEHESFSEGVPFKGRSQTNDTAVGGRNDTNPPATNSSPLLAHNMDEAPVTRYNVQNLVPSNGHLPSSPIDGNSGGVGHGALYQANTAGPEHLPWTRRTFLSRSMLGPLNVWPDGMSTESGLSSHDLSVSKPAGSTSVPSATRLLKTPSAGVTATRRWGNDSWNGAPSLDYQATLTGHPQRQTHGVSSEKEHRMAPVRRLTWPRVTQRGRPTPAVRRRPTETARTGSTSDWSPLRDSYVTPAAPIVSFSSLYVTRLPPLSTEGDNFSRSRNVTIQSVNSTAARNGLLSSNVSHAIWTDLVGESLAVPQPVPSDDQPLRLLVDRLTQLGSQYMSGRVDGLDTGLAPQLEALQSQLVRLDGATTADVLVRVGANLLSSQLVGRGSLRREGYSSPAADEDSLCRCPKSSVTPGVLAALTSLLALLIYAASLATLAVTSGTTGSTGGTTATATGRAVPPALLPGLWSMSAFLLRLVDVPAVLPGRVQSSSRGRTAGTWRAAPAAGSRRLRWRLEQSGVPVTVRQRRPAGGRRPGRRLDWPELFNSLAGGAAATGTAPPNYNGPPSTGEGQQPDTDLDSAVNTVTAGENGEADSSLQYRPASVAAATEQGMTGEGNATAQLVGDVARLWGRAAGQTDGDLSPVAGSVHLARSHSPAPSRSPLHLRLVTSPARRGPDTVRRRLGLGRLFWLRWPAGRSSGARGLSHRTAAVRRGQRLAAVSQQLATSRQMVPPALEIPSPGDIAAWPRLRTRFRQIAASSRQMVRPTSGQRARWNDMTPQSQDLAPRSSEWPPSRRWSGASGGGRPRRPPPARRHFPLPPSRRPRKQMIRAAGSIDGAQNATQAVTTPSVVTAVRKDGASGMTGGPRGRQTKTHRPNSGAKGRRKPKQQKSGLNINLNLSLDNLKAKLKSSLKQKPNSKESTKSKTKPKTKPKLYGKRVMCDCKSRLGDLLGFLPLAVLVGYSTSVSTAAAAAAATGGTAGSVTVTINDADTTTIANTNSPTLTNTDNDVITTAANANPVNTNTNTLTNNDNDVITNTNSATNNGRSIAAAARHRTAMLTTLLRLLAIRSLDQEQCFVHHLCETVAQSRAGRVLLNIASVPVCLLLSSHRSGSFTQYRAVFSAGLSDTCPNLPPPAGRLCSDQ